MIQVHFVYVCTDHERRVYDKIINLLTMISHDNYYNHFNQPFLSIGIVIESLHT
jgi:hypothetical protein